jgi:hypothetical protein
MQLYLTPLERLVEQSKVERENLRMSPDRTYAPAKKLLLYQLLRAAGLADEFNPVKIDAVFSKNSLKEFASECQKQASKIQELFKINVRGDVDKKAMQQLSKILELIGLDRDEATREKIKGISTRYYQISPASWETVRGIIEKRLETVISSTPNFDFSSDAQKKRTERKIAESRPGANSGSLILNNN